MMRCSMILVLGLFFTINLRAQLYKETVPIYNAALKVLASEYAVKQFPSKVVQIASENNLPDTITVSDNRLFNFGKFVRSTEGKAQVKQVSVILTIINADSDVSIEERALLDAIKNSKKLTIYSTRASDAGYAVSLTFDPAPEAKQLLESFYQKGISINTLQHMHMRFIDSDNINNWLEYYYGDSQQKELAVAFMQYKLLSMAVNPEYKRMLKLFEDFINGIQSDFANRDQNLYPNATSNILLNMIKEFDEAAHISLPDYVYLERMKD